MEEKHTPETCYQTYQNPTLCMELLEYLLNSGMVFEILETCQSWLSDNADLQFNSPVDGTKEQIERVLRFRDGDAIVKEAQSIMDKSTMQKLWKLKPYGDAVRWSANQPSKQAAWDNCERGDWMLWMLGQSAMALEDKGWKKLVLAACDCAALIIKYTNSDAGQAICKCLKITRMWAYDKTAIGQVGHYADKADGATETYFYYAASTAHTAAEAVAGAAYKNKRADVSDEYAELVAYAKAEAAYSAADAAEKAACMAFTSGVFGGPYKDNSKRTDYAAYATVVANAAAYAAYASGAVYTVAVAASRERLKHCAKIVREHYPISPKR